MLKVSSKPPSLLCVVAWAAPISILMAVGLAWFSAPKFYTYGKIQIKGSVDFAAHVTVALERLKQRSPADFQFVETNIPRIFEHRCTGMHSTMDPPTCCMSLDCASTSVTWCAAALAHEAHHASLAKIRGHVYGKQIEELECIAYQLQVLERIGGTAAEIEWGASQDGMHFDSNGDGEYTWEDYRNRRY